MLTTSPTRQSRTQCTPTIPHEPKNIWVYTTAWRIQLRRHATSPTWYTSDYPWKATCERHMGIPWSKGMLPWSLNEPISVPSRVFHQNNRITILRLRWISPHNTPLPYNYSWENVTIAAREIVYALKNPAPQDKFSNIGDSQIVANEQLSKIFS